MRKAQCNLLVALIKNERNISSRNRMYEHAKSALLVASNQPSKMGRRAAACMKISNRWMLSKHQMGVVQVPYGEQQSGGCKECLKDSVTSSTCCG